MSTMQSKPQSKPRTTGMGFCEFCARQTDPQNGSPLCDRCLSEMNDARFAAAVERGLPAESRAALARILGRQSRTP